MTELKIKRQIKKSMLNISSCNMKSVKSINPIKSVIQTIYDIVKAHGVVPIAIGIKVETKEGNETEFIIFLPII